MAERNIPPCETHGSLPRAFHEHNFEGIITVLDELLATVSGVGTTSYSRCPFGYGYNFEGVVRALEDLNTSISGISSGGGGGTDIAAGSGIYFTASGTTTIINANVVSSSGFTISAGSGIYLTDGNTQVNVNYDEVYQNVISGQFLDEGSVTITYSGDFVIISGAEATGGGGGGSSVVVSGSPGTDYGNGSLWFDSNQGRLFVYASGGSVSTPDWYQTNSEAIALKSETAPSGTGENAPPRDGSIWFSTLTGSLFVYDVTTSGWYETGPQRSVAYGSAAPSATVQGAGWYSTTDTSLKIWNGSAWVDANT